MNFSTNADVPILYEVERHICICVDLVGICVVVVVVSELSNNNPVRFLPFWDYLPNYHRYTVANE